MTELEEFRSMLRLSFHEYTEGPLDGDDSSGCVVVHVKPDVNDQVTVVFTFDDDGDLSSLYPVLPENWRVTVVGREGAKP